MGAVKKDLHSSERALDAVYPLDTPEGVYALLSDIHRVRNARFYQADFSACDMLLDLSIAMRKVKFTQRQTEALNLVFIQEYTQKEAVAVMGCSQQAVQQHVWAAVKKIAQQYEQDSNTGRG